MKHIKATYLIETAYPLEKAALILAGEQSCGTFIPVPGETDELKKNHCAKIESINEIKPIDKPSLPGTDFGIGKNKNSALKQAVVSISWPLHNFGINLPNLMATIAGNLFELKPFSGIRLLDFEVPDQYKQKFPPPVFGIKGTRKLTGVVNRPIIGTIIKPSVGLSPAETAARVKELATAGLDFIKDDELMGDPPHCPFEQRVKKVMAEINKIADKIGKKCMYAFNISGNMEDMKHRHDLVLKQGGTCIMLSLNWVGISAAHEIVRHSRLPVHGHRNGWGALSRCPVLGFDFKAYQKLWRLVGIDHLHCNGLRNKFTENDDQVISAIKACLTPWLNGYEIMPVLSSGQWAGQAVDTYKAVNSTDLIYLCGGGIIAHPDGIAAGVESVRQGWEAAIKGKTLSDYAKNHQQLKNAMAFFNKKT